MRIALDAMGSDRAPSVEIEGAVGALRELEGDFRIVLVGDEALIEAELARHPDAPRGRIDVVHAPGRIEMGESPAHAIRRKQDSSMVVGLNLQKRGEADAFISAGSTGAAMAGSVMILGVLPGVDRPAVGTVLPTASGHTLMIDGGANVDTRAQHLLQFAFLGSIYARDLMGIESPRVGLLNIGEEPEKGDERAVEAHRLLAAASDELNFVGNIEGRDVIRGKCDVLVCDGFVGNVLLKFYESVAGFMLGMLRQEMADANVQLDLTRMFHTLDYTEYGGAPLLGVNGVTIICHGGSPPRAIRNAIRVAAQAVDRQMVSHIERQLSRRTEAPLSQ
ncbi:MAG TPA: phosphate acyltransferase PlsX [Longimicrobiaceae bacterium]|jgi:glycerol-3-phosphate acyltransferase PlsX